MDIEKLCNYLKKEFIWVFCDTCANEGKDCGDCSKKLMQDANWELSDEAALNIAMDIRDMYKEDQEEAE